jgi:CRP/FNR family cyclic AMP-dependent transcriptional regulator
MARDSYAEQLRMVPLFASLTRKELGLVLKQASRIVAKPGDVLVQEGKPGSEFFLIAEGRLVASIGGRDVDTLGPGEFFGELAIIDPAPRNATITAATDAVVLVIGRREFWALLQDVPLLSRKVMVHLAQRVRAADLRRALD